MNKIIITLMLLAHCAGSMAQEKLFKEGLERGRSQGSFYFAKNKKGKGLPIEKMSEYASKHNYLLGKSTNKRIERFGDVQTALDEFYFLPRDEYPNYVLEHTVFPIRMADLKQKGSCFLFSAQKFIKFENVFWSGTLSNGMLDGEGYAFWYDDNQNLFHVTKGKFQGGLPLGEMEVLTYRFNKSHPDNVGFEVHSKVNVGKLCEGLAHFTKDASYWGFVNSNGEIAINNNFRAVVKDFSNGKAEVVNMDNKEIIIDKSGKYVDLTAKQKQLDIQEEARRKQAEIQKKQEELRLEQERKNKELEERQKRIERERLAAEAEKRRKEKFRNCEPGDRVYFSQEWEHTERWLLFFTEKHSYTMRVVCFVEQNLKNGERLQIRVGSVESSSSNYYSTPKIDGIEYRKGDVLWIKPLNDTRWQIE